ncbi:transposase [Clostridium pasteurianum]|uniref:transposase n=1 Tax=Clostridium pasteurianum TaxID=1501 RepID=UPI0022608EF8|nr:transposase [Clostridium pasteurianum]UZW14823.1 transposase [Clostridium pasteurianum]
MFCITKIEQLTIFEQVSELNHMASNQPVGFIKLLSQNFDIATFIPESFTQHYYDDLGRDRKYPLTSVLSALLIMQIFHILTTTLLTIFLIFSTEIRDFCSFYESIPDESFFSRFKTDFRSDIANLFDSMALEVIDICEKIDDNLPEDSPYKNLSSMLIYDTSGLKPKVKENNPKTLVAEINRQKSYAKATNKENFNPYAAAYKNMPKFAQANPNIRLDFVNGHFGYFYKFGLLTNGLGIPLNLKFFDEKFYKPIEKEFDTPEDQKYFYDNASLKSVIIPFLDNIDKNSNFKFKTFLGDSEFDSYENFGLFKSLNFEKVFIPLNPRNQANNKLNGLEYDIEGVPLCPLTKEQFKADGPCKGKNRSLRYKFTCPKSHRDKKGKCYHTCEDPCTDSKSGRMTYVYPDKDFRLYPGVQRNSTEWDETYPTRASIERCLASLKSNPCIEKPRTVNTLTMRSDLYLTCIAKLINVILAYAINKPEYIRSINKLLKIA